MKRQEKKYWKSKTIHAGKTVRSTGGSAAAMWIMKKEKKNWELKKHFLSLPGKKRLKYFDVFKHTLSGNP